MYDIVYFFSEKFKMIEDGKTDADKNLFSDIEHLSEEELESRIER